MYNIEIRNFFPQGKGKGDVLYSFAPEIYLPHPGPGSIDEGSGREKKEVVMDFPVVEIYPDVSKYPDLASDKENFMKLYESDRKRRKEGDWPYPNELVGNLLGSVDNYNGKPLFMFSLTDYSTINGVLKKGALKNLPQDEIRRISRLLAPAAPGAIVESSDGYIPLGVRGKIIQGQGGKLMPFPCGHPVYYPAAKKLETPFEALKRETEEELPHQVKDERMHGLVWGSSDEGGSWVPVIFYIQKSAMDKNELFECYKKAPEKNEHERFISIPIDNDFIGKYICDNYSNWIDNGLAEMLLYVRVRFGESWYENLSFKLVKEKGLVLNDPTLK
jgi:hypothetical protein